MEIHLIWAQDNNGGIGKNNQLPWHISEDLQNFKKITQNSTIIMGRKTWESLPKKPLPNRRNIVLSSSKINNIECYDSIEKCLKKIQIKEKVFIVGGVSIYKSFINIAQYLHITFIDLLDNEIDTFFPSTMNTIDKEFNKIKTRILSPIATYTLWKNKNAQ